MAAFTVAMLQSSLYFEELVKLVEQSNPPDAKAISELRGRYDTQQLSALKAS